MSSINSCMQHIDGTHVRVHFDNQLLTCCTRLSNENNSIKSEEKYCLLSGGLVHSFALTNIRLLIDLCTETNTMIDIQIKSHSSNVRLLCKRLNCVQERERDRDRES
jgi:hypothetical protein